MGETDGYEKHNNIEAIGKKGERLTKRVDSPCLTNRKIEEARCLTI